MKKLYLVLCLALCMVAFTACGNSKKTTSKTSFDESTLKSNYESTVEGISGGDYNTITDEEQYETYVTQFGDEIAQSLRTFVETTQDLGKYKSCEKEVITYSDDTATVEGKVKFEKDTVVIRMTFTKDSKIQSFSTELYKTFGQKMVKAALNTVMGMGTVFIVLIFISMVINLLKFVPKLVGGMQKAPEQKVEAEVATEMPMEEEDEDEELASDSELVAVITAAIMASMGEEAPADGLVVRSIRRVNTKWKNA